MGAGGWGTVPPQANASPWGTPGPKSDQEKQPTQTAWLQELLLGAEDAPTMLFTLWDDILQELVW